MIKEEFSSSGLGVRICSDISELATGTRLERWTRGCLVRDGVVTVEPWLDIIVEFSAEYVYNTHPAIVTILFANEAHYDCVFTLQCGARFTYGGTGG